MEATSYSRKPQYYPEMTSTLVEQSSLWANDVGAFDEVATDRSQFVIYAGPHRL